MRNIIFAYTCLLQFHLCSALNIVRNFEQKSDEETNALPDRHRSFIVRKQRRCNFCGHHLDQPQSFTFSTKCHNCSLRNSALILPTHSICDACNDHQASKIFLSDKINLSHSRHSHSSSSQHSSQNTRSPLQLKSANLLDAIQSVITDSLRLFIW